MRKERKKVLNILYWNINHREGNFTNKYLNLHPDETTKKLEVQSASNIVNNEINRYDNIDVIVLTEAYPQITEYIYNDSILNNLKNDYNVYPYCDSWKDYVSSKSIDNGARNENGLYEPFKRLKCGRGHSNYANCVLIAIRKSCKYSFEIIDYKIDSPNLLVLKDEKNKVFIIGFRISVNLSTDKYTKELTRVLKEYKNYKDEYKLICMGDFNPSKKTNNEIKEILKSDWINLINCEGGSSSAIVDNRIVFSNPDKLLLNKCGKECFRSLITPEEIYTKGCQLDGWGHINKKEYFDDVLYVKREYIKDIYKDVRIRLCHGDFINPPFPDHNLLFASILI